MNDVYVLVLGFPLHLLSGIIGLFAGLILAVICYRLEGLVRRLMADSKPVALTDPPTLPIRRRRTMHGN